MYLFVLLFLLSHYYYFLSEGAASAVVEGYSTGDVVGCGFKYSTREIFFTKNGELVSVPARFAEGADLVYYPTVGFHESGCSVRFNFGTRPFVFQLSGVFKDGRRVADLLEGGDEKKNMLDLLRHLLADKVA